MPPKVSSIHCVVGVKLYLNAATQLSDWLCNYRCFQKKQAAEKRRADSSSERSSFKQRRLEEKQTGAQVSTAGSRWEEVAPLSFLTAVVVVLLFTDCTQADRKPLLRRPDAGKGGIKTSSLFKHNPDIPEIHR